MAGIRELVAGLRREETRLAKQLAGIKDAISSLEFGSGGGAPKPGIIVRGVKRGRPRKFAATARPKARKRTVSAAQRKAQSTKMKAYWANKRAAGAKK